MRRYRKIIVPLLLCALVGCGGSWSSGDRVLVAKFLYDSDLVPPQRYDVVVFKFPERPIEKGTPKNYIKRLLGLPGELFVIFFGRLFSYTPEKVPYDYKQQIPPNDLWMASHGNLLDWSSDESVSEQTIQEMLDRPEAQRDELEKRTLERNLRKKAARELVLKAWEDGKLTILRKPLDTMMSLRRIVYDNDKQPRDLKGVLPARWQPWPMDKNNQPSQWVADESNGFKIEPNDNREQWLRYQHILRPSDWPKQPLLPVQQGAFHRQAEIDMIKSRKHDPQLITDFMGYNTYETPQGRSSYHNWVGDLMLECKLTVKEAKGECWLELSKGVDRFQARINLESGVCKLFRLSVKKNQEATLEEKEMSTTKTRINAPGTYQLRFANIDERLTLWVDSDLPFNDGHNYDGPKTRGPDPRDKDTNNDLQPASIASKGAKIQVHQLK